MNISFTRRLSYKQASLTVLVAFILGTLLSLLQVGIDYRTEDASIDSEIHALLEVSRNPATRITYNIDAELAHELVLGLLNSPGIVQAEILDNSGSSLASVSRARLQSSFRFLSDFLFGSERSFSLPLYINRGSHEVLGQLDLEVDTYAFGSRFLNRVLVTFSTGFVRSLLLSLILLVLFYFMLTKPLVSVVRAISEHDPGAPVRQKLSCPSGHEQDEIGVLVEVTNAQLSNITNEIDRRREAEERLTQYLGELENIIETRTTELKASNARLSASNQELEVSRSSAVQMAQARAAFLASMSHEIRTPLNGLLGMLDLALDAPMANEQRQQLTIASESGAILLELLNDILDLSKVEAGQLQLERIPFDLASLAEETVSLLSQNAADDVELTCLIDPQLADTFIGDPTRVRQIISNLLSNALKFTHSGRVDLRINNSPLGVQIIVRDTGIGIAQAAQAKIFQPFIQAGAGITRQYGGSGLGLALTRTLCETMQGRLSLVSHEGVGSQFCVDLPLLSQSSTTRLPALQGRVAALVDDNSGVAELLATLLPSWGLSYQRFDNLQAAEAFAPSLLISTDPATLEQLRAACQAPLLLISRYANFLSSEQSNALTPFKQLAQPLARHTLHQALSQLLLPQSQLQSPPPAALIAPEPSAQPTTQRAPRVLLVEDNAVNQMVAKGMLSKMGCSVLVANHGAEALERLAQEPVDLVLMDCNMPVMDGYEASRRIRQNPDWSDLPIIALTANAMLDERTHCIDAGMNDYLAKPFRMEQLVSLVQQWLPNGLKSVVTAKP
ncbi:MAG: response regulator, partial [Pseudomonas sp.]|nr:response regulator [Pseudomonas sp.]MDO9321832.1 response regulator [Pseudomonas sp.]